jgi:phosphoglycerate-specific signal transduction histidine kinase
LKCAVLTLLEKLRPAERAAYVLREAFNYSSRQIADILQLKETNVRQLLTRARRHIAEGRRARASSAERRRLLVALIDAAQNGNLAELEGLFASDVVIHSDRGNIGAMNQDAINNLERLEPEQDLTWCHKTLECSVLTDTTGSYAGSDRNEGDDLEEAEVSSVSLLQPCGFLHTVSIACA